MIYTNLKKLGYNFIIYPVPFGVAEKDPGAGVVGLVRSGSGDEEDVFHDVSTGETPRDSEGRLTDPLLTRI